MQFASPVKLSDGRYFVKITNQDGSRVTKQLNGCTVVGPGCYKITADLTEYDNAIVTQATESSQEWFTREMSQETLEKMYETSVTSDVFEASNIKVKGKCVTTVFDAEKNEVSIDALETGVECNLIVELTGIWFLRKTFGPIWRVVQAKLRPKNKSAVYLFVDEEEPQDDAEPEFE
jgi:hypothetical protein